ncbi:hypothetical protein V1505DRAFT_133012 [Lipomyces doorenjongii]
MRTKGAALGAATNWIFNYMVVEITPVGIQILGWRFYIVWIALNAAMIPVFLYFIRRQPAALWRTWMTTIAAILLSWPVLTRK